MKKKFELFIGLFALLNVVYKIAVCLNCDDNILWFEVSGIVYTLFWTFLAVMILHGVYKANWGVKES